MVVVGFALLLLRLARSRRSLNGFPLSSLFLLRRISLELCDQVFAVQVLDRLPGVPLVSESFPLEEVLGLSGLLGPFVEDLLDDVLFLRKLILFSFFARLATLSFGLALDSLGRLDLLFLGRWTRTFRGLERRSVPDSFLQDVQDGGVEVVRVELRDVTDEGLVRLDDVAAGLAHVRPDGGKVESRGIL